LSPAFISKGWTNYELDGIVTRAISGEQILLPIWHNITKQEVVDFSPSLADKVARSTATHTIDEIARDSRATAFSWLMFIEIQIAKQKDQSAILLFL
jgi:hypothetical protein